MRVTVLLFSSYAEALGRQSVELDLPEQADIEQVLAAVRGLAAPRPLPGALVAVNHRYAAPGTEVRSGDEIAIIPPVAGG